MMMVPIGLYGFQHYISILGSLILIPLVIVPAMGGTYEDTSNVVSTVLFVSSVTTLLHSTFGSRLPLIQGPSFVYLAPALAIINAPEFQGLNANLTGGRIGDWLMAETETNLAINVLPGLDIFLRMT